MTNETAEHWAAQTDRFNFESFAADEAYRQANREPVSYTHLDVYKRQMLADNSYRTLPKLTSKEAWQAFEAAGEGSNDPVSYTHLDVYKRQMQSLAV